jgi:hypothetical protein
MTDLPEEAKMKVKVKVKCTYFGCEEPATRVFAQPPSATVRCVHVAPYCGKHAEGIEKDGGIAAAGPALSEDVRSIEGIR